MDRELCKLLNLNRKEVFLVESIDRIDDIVKETQDQGEIKTWEKVREIYQNLLDKVRNLK